MRCCLNPVLVEQFFFLNFYTMVIGCFLLHIFLLIQMTFVVISSEIFFYLENFMEWGVGAWGYALNLVPFLFIHNHGLLYEA